MPCVLPNRMQEHCRRAIHLSTGREMTIQKCPTCGGMHFGSNECPYIEAPCVVCGNPTILACSDCAIESGGKSSVHVCAKEECRHEHEFWQHRAQSTSGRG